MSEWLEQSREYLSLAHHIAQTNLITKYKKSILDRCLRGASDLISCESINVHNNTMSMIQWCLRWSEQALETYYEVEKELTEQRGGKPPTHRQVCNARDSFKTRYWTVEHEHPLIIPKEGLMFENWNFHQLSDWMFTYGYATIITQSENKGLTSFTKDMEEAKKRYSDVDIKVLIHPHHRRDTYYAANGTTG
jgi:hypothetical protein